MVLMIIIMIVMSKKNESMNVHEKTYSHRQSFQCTLVPFQAMKLRFQWKKIVKEKIVRKS